MPEDPRWTPERTLAALLDALDEAVIVFDADLRYRAASPRITALFGTDPRDLRDLRRAQVIERLSAASDDPAGFQAAIDRAFAGDLQEITLARPDPRVVRWSVHAIPADAGTGAGWLDIVRDLTPERTAQRRAADAARALADAATVDPLTGLLNRKRFLQDLDREHRRAQRAWDSYAIARIDVDGMTAFNEAHGREAGDTLLRRLADELRVSRREYDLVARWEEDELVVCLPGVDAKTASVVVRRALVGMREKADAAGGVTLSAGIAVWVPPSGEGPEDMVCRAGAALDAGRAQGPSSVLVDAGAGRWKDEMG